jgi:hypothetical protein
MSEVRRVRLLAIRNAQWETVGEVDAEFTEQGGEVANARDIIIPLPPGTYAWRVEGEPPLLTAPKVTQKGDTLSLWIDP